LYYLEAIHNVLFLVLVALTTVAFFALIRDFLMPVFWATVLATVFCTRGMVSVGRAVSGGHGDLQGAGAPGPLPITAVLSPTPLCPSYALSIKVIAPMHGPTLTAHVDDMLRTFRDNALAPA
jgi:hypothetical protein